MGQRKVVDECTSNCWWNPIRSRGGSGGTIKVAQRASA